MRIHIGSGGACTGLPGRISGRHFLRAALSSSRSAGGRTRSPHYPRFPMHPNPPPTTIRDATPDEREVIRRLTLEAYSAYASIMEPKAWEGLGAAIRSALADGDVAQWIVAMDGHRVLGSVLLFPPETDTYGSAAATGAGPELRLLAVAPAARGRGVGRALVEECIRRARSVGAPEIGLHTSRSMKAAIRLYESIGFERIPQRDFQPPGGERVNGYRLPL